MLKLVTSLYCLTETMLADILTKEVPKAKHIWCVYNFGLKLKRRSHIFQKNHSTVKHL